MIMKAPTSPASTLVGFPSEKASTLPVSFSSSSTMKAPSSTSGRTSTLAVAFSHKGACAIHVPILCLNVAIIVLCVWASGPIQDSSRLHSFTAAFLTLQQGYSAT
jgi:hypothetical protein